MLYDLLYYVVLPAAAITASLGAWYIWDPDNVKNKLFGLSWRASKFYVECSEYAERFTNNFRDNISTNIRGYKSGSDFESDNEDEEEETTQQSLICYISKEKTCYTVDVVDECVTELLEKHPPSIMFLKTQINDTVFYKRTDSPLIRNTEFFTMTHKPFIQIEFIKLDNEGKSSGDNIDIHPCLECCYVNGNTILDRAFLEWYLDCYYKLTEFNDYELRIFDKDVNMFTVSSAQAIQLEDDTYKIIEVENKSTNVVQDTYEGAEEE